MITFDTVWSWLQSNLKPGQTIKNWSGLHGYLGRSTTIVSVCNEYIEVDPPKAKNIQVVPRDDFRKLWEDWSAYKGGKVARSTFLEKSRFITYIISIFHYYEQEILVHA
jgi:hypothetical protein